MNSITQTSAPVNLQVPHLTVKPAARNYRKGTPTFETRVGVDTEFVTTPDQRPEWVRVNQPRLPITVQLAYGGVGSRGVILEHPRYANGARGGHNPSFSDCALVEGLGLLPSSVKPEAYLVVDCVVFYSAADIIDLFTHTRDRQRITRALEQDTRLMLTRNKHGFPVPFDTGYTGMTPDGVVVGLLLKVTDLSRISPGGLGKLLTLYGLSTDDKGLMDAYKTCMNVAYESPTLRPTFEAYAMADARCLLDIIPMREREVASLHEVHGLEVTREYFSNGSLVSDLFLSYVHKLAGGAEPWALLEYDGKPLDLPGLLAHASVNQFLSEASGNHRRALSLVLGGRAKNENPAVMTGELVVDSDGAGAYVSQMRSMVYPVGIPATWAKDLSQKDETRMTLGEFLKATEGERLCRLWHVVVRGTLSFPQTLLHSKSVKKWALAEEVENLDDKGDVTNIHGDFSLYTHELDNAVITSDFMDMLRASCSPGEMREFLGVEVISAAWYPASLRCKTFAEMGERIKAEAKTDRTESLNSLGRTETDDARPRHWVGVSLDDFLGPYAVKRKEYQAQYRALKGTPEGDRYNALQTSMKLVGNTFYGTTASDKLPTCNTIVANNITAGLRCWVYGLAAACGAIQSITDGGAHMLNRARFHNADDGAFFTMGNLAQAWLAEAKQVEPLVKKLVKGDGLKRRTLKAFTIKPLGGAGVWQGADGGMSDPQGGGEPQSLTRIWNESLDREIIAPAEGWDELNQLVHAHMIDFWSRKGECPGVLEQIQVSIKDVYELAAFQGQTDYFFQRYDGAQSHKARGHLKGNRYNGGTQETNKKLMFLELLADPSRMSPLPPQTYTRPLKVNAYNTMERAAMAKGETTGLTPGDTSNHELTHRHMSMAPFHYRNQAEKQLWARLSEDWKVQTGFGLEGAFLNPDGTIDFSTAQLTLAVLTTLGPPPIKGKGQDTSPLRPTNTKGAHPYIPSKMTQPE